MRDPATRSCFRLCRSCFRCADKGSQAQCSTCSGRHDPAGRRDPYDIDDRCRCTEGILQYRAKNGRLLRCRFPHDPFGGHVTYESIDQDERDWEAYVEDLRERLDDEHYDPVRFGNGRSTLDWTRSQRNGKG